MLFLIWGEKRGEEKVTLNNSVPVSSHSAVHQVEYGSLAGYEYNELWGFCKIHDVFFMMMQARCNDVSVSRRGTSRWCQQFTRLLCDGAQTKGVDNVGSWITINLQVVWFHWQDRVKCRLFMGCVFFFRKHKRTVSTEVIQICIKTLKEIFNSHVFSSYVR